jgi:rubredoxin
LEIPKICQRIEEVIWGNAEMDENEIYEKVITKGEIISQVILEDLELPKFSLPYYEGFNRYGEKTWLGIYRRNETFSVDFLQEICELCLETKIGQICTTPWKSLIIKGIENKHRNLWDKLLGKHTINVRHAANELNWQVEDLAPEGLALKKAIIREFDEEDVRTFGLSFAVQTRSKSEIFGSVVIKKRNILGGLSSVFDVYHTTDFNPNTRALIIFEKGINKAHVPEILQRLTKRFYAQNSKNKVSVIKQKEVKVSDLQLVRVHQCKTCFTIYDERFGDSVNEVPVSIKFVDLPSTYRCPVCENDKSEFVEVALGGLLI